MDGSGSTLVIEHTSDNNLMTFRYKNTDVKMLVAEEDFDLNGRKLRAGRIHHSQRRPRQARATAEGAGAFVVGRFSRAFGEDSSDDAAANRIRAFVVAHAG